MNFGTVNSLDLSKLRKDEYSKFIEDILTIIKNNNPATLQVQDLYASLLTHFDTIESLFKTPAGSLLTDNLIALDIRRDNALIGMTGIVKATIYSTDIMLKNAALCLVDFLNFFGSSISTDNYQSETTTIRNIIAGLDGKPELMDAIVLLNLAGWKKELENANTHFSIAYLARAKESGIASLETLKIKRLDANEAYYKLRTRLNSYLDINDGAEPYNATVCSINSLIDNYNALLSRRGSGNDTIKPGTLL